MITYHDLKNKPKEFLAVTGLTHEEFLHLLAAFSTVYEAAYQNTTVEGQPRRRKPGGGTHAKLHSMEDKLLFILTYEKTYELQTLLGLHFGLSQSQVNHWIHRLMPLCQVAAGIMSGDHHNGAVRRERAQRVELDRGQRTDHRDDERGAAMGPERGEHASEAIIAPGLDRRQAVHHRPPRAHGGAAE